MMIMNTALMWLSMATWDAPPPMAFLQLLEDCCKTAGEVVGLAFSGDGGGYLTLIERDEEAATSWLYLVCNGMLAQESPQLRQAMATWVVRVYQANSRSMGNVTSRERLALITPRLLAWVREQGVSVEMELWR